MRRATAAPMPVPPPVMKAVLPENLMIPPDAGSADLMAAMCAAPFVPSCPSGNFVLTERALIPADG
jgi:hypothetical protein